MSETQKPLLPYPPPDEAGRIAAVIHRMVRLLAYPRDNGEIPLVPRNAPAGTDVVMFVSPDMVRQMVTVRAQQLASVGYFIPELDRLLSEAEASANPPAPPLDPFVAADRAPDQGTDTQT